MSLFSDLVAKANLIKNETVDEANSADRIGQMFIDLINFAASSSGILKGMSVEWDLNYAPIPPGFVLADGYGGVKCNGVTVPDHRDRFVIGYNPAKFPLPADATGLVENYGKVGNTGGKNWYKLTGAQSGLQEHDHPITDIESDNSGDAKNAFKIENTDHLNTSTMKTAKVAAKDATEDHDNRPQYIVVCIITKVSDDYTAEYNSAYHSYLDTTTDNPKLTEAEWVAALKGDKGDKGVDGIIGSNGQDGTSVPVNISIFKTGANGITLPQKFKWINDITVTSVELMDNCLGISVTIGAATYNETTLVGVTITAGTQLIINDLTIVAGQTNANAIIIC